MKHRQRPAPSPTASGEPPAVARAMGEAAPDEGGSEEAVSGEGAPGEAAGSGQAAGNASETPLIPVGEAPATDATDDGSGAVSPPLAMAPAAEAGCHASRRRSRRPRRLGLRVVLRRGLRHRAGCGHEALGPASLGLFAALAAPRRRARHLVAGS